MRRWVLGVLASVLILVLVADAAVLVASTEIFVPVSVPAALILNPGREAVFQIEQEGAEAATVAALVWLDLAETRASAVAGDHERLCTKRGASRRPAGKESPTALPS
jgi:hypothetical protein